MNSSDRILRKANKKDFGGVRSDLSKDRIGSRKAKQPSKGLVQYSASESEDDGCAAEVAAVDRVSAEPLESEETLFQSKCEGQA